MASAVLTSRNDHRSSDYITNFTRLQNFPNRNPNPNSNCNNFFVGNTSRNVICKPNQQQTAFIRSSINPPANSVPASSYGNGYRYITFRISSYTKTELQNLKKRLVSDLERVRILQQWICLTTTEKLLKYHPPELNIPAVIAPNRSVGRKRSNPAPPVMKMKKQCGGSGGRMTSAQRRKMMMKKCEQILGKLMMHKHGWVFNTPVDAVALKLYDYHSIISNPMDLGTIKCKLARNVYESALAFANDVRLTFQNAMMYNGKGSAVYIMAERLLLMFEGLFESMHHQKRVVNQVNRVKKQNQSAGVPVSIERIEKVSQGVVDRVSKRPEMTDEEKADLAESFCNLQLGPEGMNQIMSIMKKGVRGLEHQGDEIELDLAVLDNDTLWALHGFIARARAGLVANLVSSVQADQPSGEEYVDIGEEMQLTVFPSVEIEKDDVDVDVNMNVSSSELSSDSDSSSSDSGSGNSCNEQEVNSTPKVGP